MKYYFKKKRRRLKRKKSDNVIFYNIDKIFANSSMGKPSKYNQNYILISRLWNRKKDNVLIVKVAMNNH